MVNLGIAAGGAGYVIGGGAAIAGASYIPNQQGRDVARVLGFGLVAYGLFQLARGINVAKREPVTTPDGAAALPGVALFGEKDIMSRLFTAGGAYIGGGPSGYAHLLLVGVIEDPEPFETIYRYGFEALGAGRGGYTVRVRLSNRGPEAWSGRLSFTAAESYRWQSNAVSERSLYVTLESGAQTVLDVDLYLGKSGLVVFSKVDIHLTLDAFSEDGAQTARLAEVDFSVDSKTGGLIPTPY